MKFMLQFLADEDAWMALSEDERNAAIANIGRWYGEQTHAGRIVDGCRLAGKTFATTIALGPAGRSHSPIRMKGTYLDAKETFGSYAIVDVADLDEAIAVAERWPAGGYIEIRPVVEG